LARIRKAETKPLALVNSNILVYAMLKDYPDKARHEKCLSLLEKGLKGELSCILAVNPIIVVEVFTVLRKMLSCSEAQSRISSLLDSRRIGYLSVTREACQTAVQWAKQANIPVNDALIAASMTDNAQLIYTADEKHFRKLEEYNVTIINPTVSIC
jgi:predicted nucleic acid-binding protein